MNWPTAAERAADIKANVPLSSVVGAHVVLKGSGNQLQGCCPFHEDRTPSFFVNDEKGLYHCFGCGASGDVIKFVRDYMNMPFNEACNYIDTHDAQIPFSTQWMPKDRTDRSEHARRIWAECGPIAGTPAERYLEKRAIPIELAEKQESLRFGRLSWEGGQKLHPALVLAITNLAGEVQGIQRIYLTEEGDKIDEDCKRTLGSLRGGAVKFVGEEGPSPAHHLYLTEGPEDALSVALIQRHATVWAALGTGNLSKVILPQEVTEVTIANDNDDNGWIAALDAKAQFLVQGRKVDFQTPSEFKDWNAHLVYWEKETSLRHYNQLPWNWEECQMLDAIGFDEYDNYDDLWKGAPAND